MNTTTRFHWRKGGKAFALAKEEGRRHSKGVLLQEKGGAGSITSFLPVLRHASVLWWGGGLQMGKGPVGKRDNSRRLDALIVHTVLSYQQQTAMITVVAQ